MSIVTRSSRAEIDLLELWNYIAKDDPIGADNVLDRLQRTMQMLAANPHVGQRRDDLYRGIRFYPEGRYLIFYTATADGISIARILHGARDYAAEFR